MLEFFCIVGCVFAAATFFVGLSIRDSVQVTSCLMSRISENLRELDSSTWDSLERTRKEVAALGTELVKQHASLKEAILEEVRRVNMVTWGELQDQNESLLAVLYRIDDLSREHGEILRTLKVMEMEKLEREAASLARKKPSKK